MRYTIPRPHLINKSSNNPFPSEFSVKKSFILDLNIASIELYVEQCLCKISLYSKLVFASDLRNADFTFQEMQNLSYHQRWVNSAFPNDSIFGC